ncbi:hypothetical protein P154DRAFT_571207 [Amniculicola lignicola CBS 123094]|uniref:Uncharacterized protein n=1 Tax=Amniculicola lignicola CBS 123094 TaxID=1392246 RepID=A0A6A5WZ73_9PLEO|nr:hypothetical protein P154DRAFT_571207 [Amniculicola lignicola CBS 123094]
MSTPETTKSTGISKPMAIGIGVGVGILVILLILLCFCCKNRRKSYGKTSEEEEQGLQIGPLSWEGSLLGGGGGSDDGNFISLGAAFDITLTGGAPGLRTSNPAPATLIGGFVFPTEFGITMLTKMKLCTSNMFVLAYSTLRRQITLSDMARVIVTNYIANMAECLFYAGVPV